MLKESDEISLLRFPVMGNRQIIMNKGNKKGPFEEP
jgi:hypothetical protein